MRLFKKLICLAALLLLVAGCARVGARVPLGSIGGGLLSLAGVPGSVRMVYRVAGFTFTVIKAPSNWPFMQKGIEEIGGMPPKEAVRKGRVKNSPYTVKGRRYHPMSVKESLKYQETGIASWYGYETRRQKGGHMTANGEAFDPQGLTAAHKYLPLPTYVRVTNLDNRRSIVVRVNDRGPFPSDTNPGSGQRVIDLSLGAAKKLGFHRKGTARVRIETIQAG